jgi:hypothetical protein
VPRKRYLSVPDSHQWWWKDLYPWILLNLQVPSGILHFRLLFGTLTMGSTQISIRRCTIHPYSNRFEIIRSTTLLKLLEILGESTNTHDRTYIGVPLRTQHSTYWRMVQRYQFHHKICTMNRLSQRKLVYKWRSTEPHTHSQTNNHTGKSPTLASKTYRVRGCQATIQTFERAGLPPNYSISYSSGRTCIHNSLNILHLRRL